MSSAAETSSRLRLVVIATLLATLILTLAVRLFDIQIRQGKKYQASAQDVATRKIIEQPARGLIVDDLGRPLANNRLVTQIGLDRGVLAKMSPSERAMRLKQAASALHMTTAEIEQKIRRFTGGTVQPVPLVADAKPEVVLQVQEQPEVYPELVATQATVRDYPAPYGVIGADFLGYISSVTDAEYAKALADNDLSINATSVVGRAGIEDTYDQWLRGQPGYRALAVDPLGRPIGGEEEVAPQAGATLVTSIDARVQALAERELNAAITTARQTHDKVTGHNFAADAGAVVVMEAKTGRIVAMASQPTYNPNVWVGGISQKDYQHLNATGALLSRPLAGQFAPGSTWKPFMTVGALSDDLGPDTKLDCSSGVTIGNRNFANYEGEAFGMIGFTEALNVSCDTFFYRVGLHFWDKYGSDPKDSKAKDPLGSTVRSFGFGQRTGVDIPGEAPGLVGDRAGKQDYYDRTKNFYCKYAQQHANAWDARDFCIEGNYFRQGDAANFSIGQGETSVTPIQLARAYAAMSNGGTVFAPTIGKAIVDASGNVVQSIAPKVLGHVKAKPDAIAYVNEALLGTVKDHPDQGFNGTLAWKFGGFPVDQLGLRGKTGSAEVLGKSSTGWVATYNKDYVVVMMLSQAGTGSGSSGAAVRAIWSGLYGVVGPDNAQTIDPRQALIPGTVPPTALPKLPTGDGMPAGKENQP